MDGRHFFQELQNRGYSFFSGVPCSSLMPLFNAIISDKKSCYVSATHEGESIAICAGAWLAGRKAAMLCQNSGLGNIVNPVVSLLSPYLIPALVISSWRGMVGTVDEPQHEIMGKVTIDLLETIHIPYEVIGKNDNGTTKKLHLILDNIQHSSLPGSVLIEPNVFSPELLFEDAEQKRNIGSVIFKSSNQPILLSRADAISGIITTMSQKYSVISTTGKCSRELFTINDHPRNFYMMGSMGCASAIGLGVSLNNSNKVVVLDGDGAMLMKLGNLATIGRYKPSNLIHIILDNGVHDSTGAQSTNGNGVSYSDIAVQFGYSNAWMVNNDVDFISAVKLAQTLDGPNFIHVLIKPGSLDRLGRPTISPADISLRFRGYIS